MEERVALPCSNIFYWKIIVMALYPLDIINEGIARGSYVHGYSERTATGEGEGPGKTGRICAGTSPFFPAVRRRAGALEAGGRFVLTFRDLTFELKELDRFIPLRSGADAIFSCFLEYEAEHVKVHDLVYTRKEEK